MPPKRSTKPKPRQPAAGKQTVTGGVLWAGLATLCLSAAAVWFFYANGSLLYWNDAESHLNIARRVLDSRTPGYRQLGTTWLPLPHILMIPFAADMKLWRSGLAAAIPSASFFIAAACFLYATARRSFEDHAAAAATVAVFVCNPNALYLQSTAMSEAIFFGCFLGLIWSMAAFRDTQRWRYIPAAGLFAAAGCLARYEGWFVLPFAVIFILVAAQARRWQAAVLFSAIAAIGPALWLVYNWWVFGNALEFYNGPSSAKAIQAGRAYPGLHDLSTAIRYYRTACEYVLGIPLFWAGLAGIVACTVRFRRAGWLLLLTALPPIFYIWNLHSGDSPIFVPTLPPNGWYNTRYALAALPFAAVACGAIVSLAPRSFRGLAAGLIILVCAGQWLLFPRPESWITWKESQVNSEGRRAWTAEAIAFFKDNYKPGQTIFSGPGDIIGIYRQLGIPIRNLLTIDNDPLYTATTLRPDLFLWERWGVGFTGSPEQTAIDKAGYRGPRYKLAKEIVVKGAPVVQIYRRPDDAPRILP